jgi:hypothetical protein
MNVMETGIFLDMNKSIIRTKGSITSPEGANRWNKLTLPDLDWNMGK